MLDTTAMIWTCVAAGFCLFMAYCFGLGIWRGRNQVAEGKVWARTQGEIVASKVEAEGSHTDDDDSDCLATVRYRYTVAGKSHESSRIAFIESGHTTRLLAQQIVDKYPKGATVEVFYNPKRPSQAVLESSSGPSLAFYMMFLVFALPGAVLASHAIAGKVLTTSEGVPIWTFIAAVAAFGASGLWLYAFIDIQRKKKRSAHWPTVTGTITESSVAEHVSRDKDDNVEIRYVPQIAYGYRVGGREYHAATIKWGFSQLYVDHEGPQKTLAKYPKGSSVPVFYDPADPSNAVLEPGNRSGTLVPLVGVLMCVWPVVMFAWLITHP